MNSRATLQYGTLPAQQGELYLPVQARPAVVCLLHGGFWRSPYGREQMVAIAEDLQQRGYAVWNVSYRRIGEPGAGWPGTFHDVLAAIDYLATQAAQLDLERVVVCGHSAGGTLALWAAAQRRARTDSQSVQVCAAVGQAPITDLVHAYTLDLGRGAVGELLGASPAADPQRYHRSSPLALLPMGVSQLIIYGAADDAVPPKLMRDYVSAAQKAGDVIESRELADMGHMEFLDPTSAAHQLLCDWLAMQTRHDPRGSAGA